MAARTTTVPSTSIALTASLLVVAASAPAAPFAPAAITPTAAVVGWTGAHGGRMARRIG